jgi:hypothetical protein
MSVLWERVPCFGAEQQALPRPHHAVAIGAPFDPLAAPTLRPASSSIRLINL